MRGAWVALALAVAASEERFYELRIEGCRPRDFALSELAGLTESQRAVWEGYDGRTLSEAAAAAFYATGEVAVERALRAVDEAVFSDDAEGRWSSRGPSALAWGGGGFGGVAVDFGCGVGRLSSALARRFASVLCVDHSTRHLDVAREALSALAPHRAHRVVAVATDSAGHEVAKYFSGQADLALSLLTLQHAVPQIQVAALEHMCDALKPGGLGYVQLLTYYDDSAYIAADCDPRRAEAEPGMHLHYLPLLEAQRHLRHRSCETVRADPCDDHVAVPGRRSTSHCLTFFRTADDQPQGGVTRAPVASSSSSSSSSSEEK